MARYIALIDYDPKASAYGAVFPDAPGCTAMGKTFDETHENAVDALREWSEDYLKATKSLPAARDIVALRLDPTLVEDFTPTTVAVSVPVHLDQGRSMRINISMDTGLVEAIDDGAKALGLTRSGFLASAAREKISVRR